MGKYRIAIVAPYPLDPDKTTGGIQKVVQNLVFKLKDDPRFDIHILTIQYERGMVYRPQKNVILHWMTASKNQNRLRLFGPERQWIVKKLKEIDPDLVHVHGTDLYGYATSNYKQPVLLTVHGILSKEAAIDEKKLNFAVRFFDWTKHRFNYHFEKITLKKAKHIVVISPYVAGQIRNSTSAEFYYIDNPINEKFFELNHSKPTNTLLYVGMIRARKGILKLVTAFKTIAEKYPEVKLNIVGKIFEPEYFNLVQAFIKDNNLEKNVHFLGRISEKQLYQEYESCLALVLNSIEESAPMVVAQAMAAGKMVIATRVGGIPFMVDEDRSGKLVDYGDHEGLVEALEYAYLNSKEVREMGLRGKEIAKSKFQEIEIVKKTKELYLQLLESRFAERKSS